MSIEKNEGLTKTNLASPRYSPVPSSTLPSRNQRRDESILRSKRHSVYRR